MRPRPFVFRALRSRAWLSILLIVVLVAGVRLPPISVRLAAQAAPTGAGFVVTADDVRFIYEQILVAQNHAAPPTHHPGAGVLLGSLPTQVHDPQHPRGLRTVDGSFNNLVPIPDQHMFGAADRLFPRLTQPVFRDASNGTSYTQKSGSVIDPEPRMISNLIVDQSIRNPAAEAAWVNPCGSGGFVCGGGGEVDPTLQQGALFIPNITPDFGLSAPYNLMFAFFGQFFDHGLDLVTKGGNGAVIMPLQPDDPLFVPGGQANFMVMTRGQLQPGADGILGTSDDVQDSMNTTTPWVDQNQTYTSHPSHQVFLRQYAMVGGRPVPDGKVLDGAAASCAPRGTGRILSIDGTADEICNIGNWAEVKAQAAAKLGLQLRDSDVFDAPLVLTDPYGHFKPGPLRGMPQLVLPGNELREGNPAANGGLGIAIPSTAFRTGHAFLNDIAHNAAPGPGLSPDTDGTITDFRDPAQTQEPNTYDDELLNRHFVTGDGRGNENIGLTMVHQLFHAEHNRLVLDIENIINTQLTAAEQAQWRGVDAGSGWGYGERLFQAARFVTEMEYQHLVFEEFARKVQPLINPFLGGITSIDPAISAEFAHTVYRLGHSMLPERIPRINDDGSDNGLRLFDAFLAPQVYNDGGTAGPLTAPAAAGAIIRGLTRQVGNELDEFVTSSVRNTLVGLPQDLPAINIARGRSEGVPPLNEVRRQFFAATDDSTVQPYGNWFEFGLNLRHRESLINFVAAYGTAPTITGASTTAAKRSAAKTLVDGFAPIMFESATTSGLNKVDLWIGGLAEKPAVFGGLLGSTFNFVFEHQLERLQDGDRFYYLMRTDGMNLRFSLEGNSLAELAKRNSTVGATMDIIFNTADFSFDAATMSPDPAPVNLGNGIQMLTLADGTKLFFDPLHTGKNITFDGGPGVDRFQGDVGDDTLLGNGGNDRLTGGEGNDTIIGGDGNDVLIGQNGDDVLKGGSGNDAMNTGPGFGADLAIGGDGDDFLVGGNDGVEYFGGPGNDFIVDGAMRSEGIFGGPGDDWLFDGDGHDGGMFGDNGNVFDLLAGLDPNGGDDVLGGGPGQDNHFGEGGDDINLMSEGSNKFFGDFGFDWITQRRWNQPGDIQMFLLANPDIPINFNDTRNFYRYVDGASGWDLNDRIVADDNVNDPTAEPERQLQPGMELTALGASKITGLADLMGPTGFNQTLPWKEGNIVLGGGGRDVLEGRAGDDLIDGDRWLDVQLVATLDDGTVKPQPGQPPIDDPRALTADVFSDDPLNPGKRLNPHNIAIQRTLRVGAPAVDTAAFSGLRAEYDVVRNLNGSVRVSHTRGPLPPSVHNTGTDTLLNVELLQFADATMIAPGANVRTVPQLAGQLLAGATNQLIAANLTLGTVTQAFSDTVALGRVISSTPAAGSVELPLTAVDLLLSKGANDTTPPTVAITFPTAGGQVAGTIVVTATASDNIGVTGVQFKLDGASLGAEDTTAPYSVSWNTGTTTLGAHILAAIARDAAGNLRAAADVGVTVALNNAPTGTPVLSQTLPQELEALSVSTVGIADLDSIVAGSFTFQWQQAPVGSTAFVAIASATAQSFTPQQAQVGQILRAIVSFTDGGSTVESLASAASGVVGDVFTGTAAADSFNGTAGRDNASGGGGNDTLSTGAGNDIVIGGEGDDVISTGDGNDSIRYNALLGFDIVDGGAGVDEIRALAANSVIGLKSLVGVESITSAGFAGVVIEGSPAADILDFSAVTLTGIQGIIGGAGNDVLTGSAVADQIQGGLGNDTLNGGGGADDLAGEAGDDTINGDAGDDGIVGGAGNDTLNGGVGDDNLDGGAGNDVINGGDGIDGIVGGAGDDTIDGGAANDVINGNGGNDVITGGAGNDTMNPGATIDNDVFRFGAGFGADIINGFGADPVAGVVGQDLLNVSALGITAANFGTRVTVAQIGVSNNTLITLRDAANVVVGTIRLNGVLPASVTVDDFSFVP